MTEKVWLPPWGTLTAPLGEMEPPSPAEAVRGMGRGAASRGDSGVAHGVGGEFAGVDVQVAVFRVRPERAVRLCGRCAFQLAQSFCFRLGFGINVVAVDRHIFFASEVVGEHQFQDFIVGRAQIFRFFGTLNQKEGYIQIQEGLAFGFAFNLGFARRVIFSVPPSA